MKPKSDELIGEVIMDYDIDDFDDELSSRAINVLKRAGIFTIFQLESTPTDSLINQAACGTTTVKEIKDFKRRFKLDELPMPPKVKSPRVSHFAARNEAIVDNWMAGETLEVIGQRHGVTRERVRQILLNKFSDIKLAKSMRKDNIKDRRTTEIMKYVDLLKNEGPQAVFEEGVTRTEIKEIRGQLPELDRRINLGRNRPSRYSIADIKKFIITAQVHHGLEIGKTLSTNQYDSARLALMTKDQPWPTVITICRLASHDNTWNTSVKNLGFVANKTLRTYSGYTKNDCIDALRRMGYNNEAIPTVASYDLEYEKDRTIPSSVLIRQKCNGWGEALKEAFPEGNWA